MSRKPSAATSFREFSKGLTPQTSPQSGDIIAASPEARAARNYEENKTYKETVANYWPAIVWSVAFAMAIVGEGYDLALMGNYFSLPQFQELFGHTDGSGPKEIPALFQSLILACSQLGQISAMCFTGSIMERFGYRKTMIGFLGSVMVFLLVNFFAVNARESGDYKVGLGMIIAGEFLLGIPWGAFQGCVLPYASDISPMKLRPALTTFVSMCWLFGQLFSTAAIKGVTTTKDNITLAYRIPVAMQWAWPLLIMLCVFRAPESPWWLIRHDRPNSALQVLRRLNRDPEYPATGQVRVLELTNEQERASRSQDNGKITYRDCFKGVNLRRTIIVVMVNLTQQLCGSCLMFYSAKLYQKAGMTASKSYDLTLIQYAIGIICIVSSWPMMNYIGRRTIWLCGLSTTVLLITTVGVLGFFTDAHPAIPWLIAVSLVVFTGVYNLSLGPLVYAITPEIPSTRQRGKTLIIGRVSYLIAGQFNMWLVPRMLENAPNGWGLGPRTALMYAGICTCFLIWAFFGLPEVKGKTEAEMDGLFKRGTATRDFATATARSVGEQQK